MFAKMKKMSTTSLAVVFTCNLFAFGTAGEDHRGDLLFGAKVGVNYSNVYDSRGEAFVADPKFGLAFGAFMAIPLSDLFGIQPEILFSRKGFKATGQLLGSPYGLTRTSTFIDVPVFFAIKPAPAIILLAGPQFSYLVRQQDVFENSTNSYQQEQVFKNENIRKNILCFVIGTDIGIDAVVLGLRAGWDVQNNHGDGTYDTPNYKNVWYQATIGFRFL